MGFNDEILGVGAIALALLVIGCLVGLAWRKDFDLRWLAIATALFVINEMALTRGFWLLPSVPGLDDDWNWSGKLLAFGVSVALITLPMLGWRESGLTLKQNQLCGALTIFAIVLGLYAGLAWTMGSGGGDAETLAYQLTMPGLEEEIFYRGLFLLALDRAFRSRVVIGGAPIGWSLPLSALVFGLVHGLSVNGGELGFDLMSFVFPFVGTVPAVWLRQKTGSVVLPIVLHNAVNTMFVVLPI